MQQHRRTNSPITDAVYPRSRKSRKPAPTRKEVDPKHGFTLAGQLDSETLKALGWSPLTGRKSRVRKGAK